MALVRTARLSTNSGGLHGTGSYTTTSFTPSDNSLLVVGLSLMETNGTTDPTGDATITDSVGLTWTRRVFGGSVSVYSGGGVIWTAPVTTGVSMTLTFDCGTRVIERYVVSVVDYTGYDTGSPTGATGTNLAPPNDGAASLTLSAAPATDNEVFAELSSDTGTGSTPATGWTEIHDNQALGDCGIQTQAGFTAASPPVFGTAGAGVITEASGGALTPLSPATVNDNDVLIIFAYYEGAVTTPNTPTGFTLLDGPRSLTTGRCWVFGKQADGTEDGAANALGTPAVTTMRAARCYRFTGARDDTITNICGGFDFGSGTTAALADTGVTTIEANSLAVNLVTVADDNALVSFTGETGGDWTEAIAEYTSAATTPDYAQQLQTAPMATAGTVNGGSQTMAAADPWGVVGFYIRGPAGPAATADWADVGTGGGASDIQALLAVEIKVAAATAFAPPFDSSYRRILHNLVR